MILISSIRKLSLVGSHAARWR